MSRSPVRSRDGTPFQQFNQDATGEDPNHATPLVPLDFTRSTQENNRYDYAPMAAASEEDLKQDAPLETAPPDSHARGPSFPRAYTFWVDGWSAESLSCLFAVAALIGLIAVLRYSDGRVVTQMRLSISLNTVIAIFGAVIKASLLLPVAECKKNVDERRNHSLTDLV